MESFHQDDVRNFMDTRASYNPITELLRGIENRARENVKFGRDSDAIVGERTRFDRMGNEERQVRRETERIKQQLGLPAGNPSTWDVDSVQMADMLYQVKQHIYHLNQNAMRRDGFPEVVTLYRGDLTSVACQKSSGPPDGNQHKFQEAQALRRVP